MERHARFERLAQQEVGAVERVSTERKALVQATAAAATPQPVDASGGSASQARAAQLRRYTPNRFVVRLFAPQVALLLLLALLGYLCFGGQSTVHLHDKHIHLSVGPGCMPRPKTAKPVPAKYNAIDNVTCEVDAPQTQSQIGPTVTMRGGGDWKKAFAPVPISEASSASRSFHFNITFTTREASCVEKADAGTLGRAPKCNGGPECTVQYYTGEFFLATSPGWVKAASFGLLSADSRYVDIILTQGWDDCMPTQQPAQGVYPVDGLLHWMLESSGQSSGFLARRNWTGTGAARLADAVDQGGEEHNWWDVLDLSTCDDGATASSDAPCLVQGYQPSVQLKSFLMLYISTTFAIVAYLHAGYRTWERMQSENFKTTLRVLFPHHIDSEKQHIAMIAAWCRQVSLRDDGTHKQGSGDKGAKSMHERFADFFNEELGIKAKYTGTGNERFGVDSSIEADVHAKHPEYREVNPWLCRNAFVLKFKPFLQKMNASAFEKSDSVGGAHARGCAPFCHKLLCRDFNKTVCEELFEQISGRDEYVSLDELQEFILFFHEDHVSDDESDNDDSPRAFNEQDALEYVQQHTEFAELVEGIEGGDRTYPISGVTALADVAMGGPDKVVRSWGRIMLTALLQSVVVIAPLILPCVMAWLRVRETAESDEIYTTASIPLVGSTADYQTFSFSLAAATVVSGMAESVAYVVSQREMLQPRDYQHKCLIEWLSIVSAFVNAVFNVFYMVSLLVTLAHLVQLVILVILALTVDPCRALAAVLAAFTLLLYIKNSISSLRKVQSALKKQITENYIKRQARRQAEAAEEMETTEKDEGGTSRTGRGGSAGGSAPHTISIAAEAKNAGIAKSSLQKLDAIVDDELERAGFSTCSLVQWVCVTLACAVLLVSVVLTAQKLFFQADQQGAAQLVASSFSSICVVFTQLGKKSKEEKQIQKSLARAERSVIKVAKTVEDLNPITKFVAGAVASATKDSHKEKQQKQSNP